MGVEWVRRCCLSFPHATEQVQWEDDLVFKVGGKMFAVTPLEPRGVYLSFKCTPEEFGELTDQPGIIPAPYLARAKWVALKSREAIPAAELRELLREAYDLVVAKLSKKTQVSLNMKAKTKPKVKAKAKAKKKSAKKTKTKQKQTKRPR